MDSKYTIVITTPDNPSGWERRTQLVVEGPSYPISWLPLMVEALRRTLGRAWLYDILAHLMRQSGDCPYHKEGSCLEFKGKCNAGSPNCRVTQCTMLLTNLPTLVRQDIIQGLLPPPTEDKK